MQARRTITMAIPVLAVQTVDQKLAALDTRLAALENLLNLQKDGSATIKATKLVLDAITVEVRSIQSISVKAGSQLDMRSGSNATLKGGSTVDIEAAATASVKGSLLKLNDGGKPVARLGDTVSPSGVIVAGSQTIMA